MRVRKNYPHVFLFVIVFLCCFMLSGCKEKGISASDWIVKQYDTLETIELFCQDMDEIVTLYVADGISTQDYLNELTILDGELALLIAAREIDEIKVGSHTVETKVGMEGYESLWNDLKELVLTLEEDNSLTEDKNKLAYTYMAYQEIIANDMDAYMEGYNSVVDSEE